MGIKDLFVQKPQEVPTVDVMAALSPFELPTFGDSTGQVYINSANALSVPSVSRAKNIICSTIAGLPKEQYVADTGAHLKPNRCINQPDKRIPGSVVYSWLAFDIWYYGVGYGQVLEMYADGRIQDWTRIAYERVTPQYNSNMTEIIGYSIDGKKMPLSGVGSVIAFPGLDEGFGNRAGRTVRAAVWLEKAAEAYAKSPVPSLALKSTGTNMTSERIRDLLTTFRKSRQDGNTTAFLNADVAIEVLGFDPAKLQLNEARQYVALELARHAGIPAYFISAETTSMTYSNSISERKSLIDFSLRPILLAIEERLSMPDFVPAGTVIRHSVDDFLRGDPLQRAQVYQILNSIGAMTVEQIKEEEDLIDNGN